MDRVVPQKVKGFTDNLVEPLSGIYDVSSLT